MKEAHLRYLIFAGTVLAFVGVSLAYGVDYMTLDTPDEAEVDDGVEVRKATKATKEEIAAAANGLENVRLEIKNTKTYAKNAERQRKQLFKQIDVLTKALKHAQSVIAKKERQIEKLHGILRSWALKRSGLIALAFFGSIILGSLGLLTGLFIGAFWNKTSPLACPAPDSAAPASAAPAAGGAPVQEPANVLPV